MPNFRQAVQLNGIPPLGMAQSVVSKTGTYTIGANDGLILCNATTAGFTVTLPTAVGASGRIYTIKKTDSTANTVTIATTSSQTIDGATTRAITLQYGFLQVQSDGANWQLTDTNLTDQTGTDIQPLGTQAAGASGAIADAKHVHAMPRLDQVTAPTAAVGLGSQKITSLANGSAATDAAAFGQIPLFDSTGTDIQGLGTQAAGSSGKIADAKHVHPASITGNLSISSGDGLNMPSMALGGTIGPIANSTALTTALSYTPAVSEPVSGSTYEVFLFGIYSTAASSTVLTWTVEWGSVTLGSNAFTMPVSQTASRWRLEAAMAFSSGTVCYPSIRLTLAPSNSANTAVNTYLFGATNGTGVTVTTNPANAIAVTLQWTTASSSNSFTVFGGKLWKAT